MTKAGSNKRPKAGKLIKTQAVMTVNPLEYNKNQIVSPLIDYTLYPCVRWYIDLYNHIIEILTKLEKSLSGTPLIYADSAPEAEFSKFLIEFTKLYETYNISKLFELISSQKNIIDASPSDVDIANNLAKCDSINRYIFMYIYFQGLHSINMATSFDLIEEVLISDSLLYKLSIYFYLYFVSDSNIYAVATCADILITQLYRLKPPVLPQYIFDYLDLIFVKLYIYRSDTVSVETNAATSAGVGSDSGPASVLYNSIAPADPNRRPVAIGANIFHIYSMDHRRFIKQNRGGVFSHHAFVDSIEPLAELNKQCYKLMAAVRDLLACANMSLKYFVLFKECFIALTEMLPASIIQIKGIKYESRESCQLVFNAIQQLTFGDVDISVIIKDIVISMRQRHLAPTVIYKVDRHDLSTIYSRLANFICVDLFRDMSDYVCSTLAIELETTSDRFSDVRRTIVTNISRLIIKVVTASKIPDITIYKQLFEFRRLSIKVHKETTEFIRNYITSIVCEFDPALDESGNIIPDTVKRRVEPFYKYDLYLEIINVLYNSEQRMTILHSYIAASRAPSRLCYSGILSYLNAATGADTSVTLYNIPHLSKTSRYEILCHTEFLFDIYVDSAPSLVECDNITQAQFMKLIGSNNMITRLHAFIIIKIETLICLMYIQTPEHIDEFYPYLNIIHYNNMLPVEFDLMNIKAYQIILAQAISKIKRSGFIQIYRPIYNSLNSVYTQPISVEPAEQQQSRLARLRSDVMTEVFNARVEQIKAANGGNFPKCMICEDVAVLDYTRIIHLWICPSCKQYVGHTKCLEQYIDENTNSATTSIVCPHCLTSELF